MRQKPNTHDLAPMRRHGFTLIELLIVIVIIAVLAVLTSAISLKIMEKAYQTNALNSMRQAATANASYSLDNNGDINVLLDADDDRAAEPIVSNSFWGRLIPYLFTGATYTDQALLKDKLKLELDAFFGTPDSDKMLKTFQRGASIHQDSSGLPVPFAFNEHIHKSNEYLKIQSFRNPAQISYFSYGFERFNEEDGQAYAPIPTASQTRTNNIDWFPNRTAAITFLDGHVEIVSAPIPDRRFKDPETTP